jgi:ABC-type glycerol-3-phosphate transport system substrate-binding protein
MLVLKEVAALGSKIDSQTSELAGSFIEGHISRRTFVTRLMALGLAPAAISAIVTACGSSSSSGGSSSAAPGELSGNVRFLVGPWSSKEVAHQQHIAKGFQALHPKVDFSFRLYDWGSASQQINTSVIEGAQDIYMTTESSYPDYEAHDTFADLTPRINDPSFAAQKKKYLYMDRIESYGPKILGLPISWHVEDAMFVNMDMVEAAGYDDTFADTWPTFLEAVTKMTKPGKTYGFGIGIQIGGYGEWYQRLRAAGGSYLTPDLKTVNVNHPDVVEATQQFADLFKNGIAPPLGTYNYDDAPAAFAAGKMAIYSSDLASTTALPKTVPFKWALMPYPPGPVSRVNFNDLSLYMVNAKSSDQDLMWEVVKWWTSAQSDAYWAGNSGTYPAEADAPKFGYSKYAAPQLGAALPQFTKYAVGLENFPQWADVENSAEAEIQNCYAGKTTAAEAVGNVAKIVQQQTGASS